MFIKLIYKDGITMTTIIVACVLIVIDAAAAIILGIIV